MSESVVRRTLTDELTDLVLSLIENGDLGPGAALPPATELARRFGVALPTMREALRRLQATGTVEIRHGVGLFVGASAGRFVLANPNPPGLPVASALRLVEARLVIEPAVAALAASHRSPADLKRLERVLGISEEALASNAVVSGQDLHFHRELAAAAGNVVLFEVIDSLLSARRPERDAIRRVFDRRHDLDQHAAILDAVRSRSSRRAERVMRAHLREIRDTVAGSARAE
jgi:GntR family transcriptional repressor for pyruvate dehydrogenase complex